MTKIYSLLFDLLIQNKVIFLSKLILIPSIVILLIWIVNLALVRLIKMNLTFKIDVKYSWLISCTVATIFMNLFFYFLIELNGVILFDWSYFTWSFNNIYVMLLPYTLAYIMPIILFFVTENQIKKLI